MSRFYLLGAVLMVGLVTARPAAACTCRSLSQCQEVLSSSAIFVGRVVSIDDGRGAMYPRRATLRVTERFVGAAESDVIINTGMGGGDCGYPFVVGMSYVVYASSTRDGLLVTSICTKTQPASSAGGDLKYLRALTQSPPAEARASGRAMSAGKPVPGVRVIAEADGRVLTVISDGNGNFELHGPPGLYHLRIETPRGMSATAPSTVTLFDSRGCGTITVSVQGAKLGQELDLPILELHQQRPLLFAQLVHLEMQ